MPGRSDIKAGGAYVELTLRNPLFLAGLKGAMRHLGGFTRQLFSLKGLLATVGGTAGLGLALRSFMKTGDELDKRVSTEPRAGRPKTL